MVGTRGQSISLILTIFTVIRYTRGTIIIELTILKHGSLQTQSGSGLGVIPTHGSLQTQSGSGLGVIPTHGSLQTQSGSGLGRIPTHGSLQTQSGSGLGMIPTHGSLQTQSRSGLGRIPTHGSLQTQSGSGLGMRLVQTHLACCAQQHQWTVLVQTLVSKLDKEKRANTKL